MIDLLYSNENIYDIINPFNKIVIATHTKPDGDAVGSTMATALYLRNIGKEVSIYIEDYNQKFDFIEGKELIASNYVDESLDIYPEVFISLDCGSIERLGANTRVLFDRAKVTINIDHHISNEGFGAYNYVVHNGSSTSETVYHVFNNDANLDKDIATAIYSGIIYDTGGFRFKSTSSDTMIVASKLISAGIEFTEIYNTVMYSNSLNEVKALGQAINNLVVDYKQNIAYTYITIEQMNNIGVTKNDIDYIVSYIMNIEKIEVSFFVYQIEDNKYKISLRSKKINVNNIAKKYNGGGHVNAAGCSMEGELSKVIDTIKKEVLREM